MKRKNLKLISVVSAAICLAAIGIACIDLPGKNSGVIVYAFDQNHPGEDYGNEWVTLHNPSNKSIKIGDWTLETHSSPVTETIPERTMPNPMSLLQLQTALSMAE